MARGDPDPQRGRPDGEPQRRAKVHRLAVDPGVYRRRGAHLQAGRSPGLSVAERGVAGCAEDDDPEPAGVERRAGAGSQRAVQGIGIVRHEHHGGIAVLAPRVVDQAQRGCLPARAQHLLRGRQERAHLGVAVGRLADRLTVDPERDVVEEHAAVDLCHVDLALDPVGERVERAGQVVPVHAQVEREMVAGPGRQARERDSVRSGHRGHHGQRSVAAGHSQHVRAARRGVTGQRGQVLPRVQDDGFDPSLARPLGEVCARGLAAT